jgi:hypothetical protein
MGSYGWTRFSVAPRKIASRVIILLCPELPTKAPGGATLKGRRSPSYGAGSEAGLCLFLSGIAPIMRQFVVGIGYMRQLAWVAKQGQHVKK